VSALRSIERALLNLSLDGYPIGPDWMRSPGWKIALDTVSVAITLMGCMVMVAAVYTLAVRAVLWIAEVTK